MKKTVILFIILFLSCAAWGTTLNKVRLGYLSSKLRVVFVFDAPFKYVLSTAEGENKLRITLNETSAGESINTYSDFKDLSVRYAEIEKDGNDLKVILSCSEKVPFKAFALTSPNRLVIDFDREFTNFKSCGNVIDGLEYIEVLNVIKDGKTLSHVLKLDLNKIDLAPALARKKKPSALESFINLFNPWNTSDNVKSFYRSRVSNIAVDEGAIAAINGSYFSYNGRPLGTLLIDKELVSSPIFGRTALIISDDQKAYIDNVTLDCYFKTANKIRYKITGINQSRDNNAVILYTPLWGKKTGTSNNGIEIVVSGGKVKAVKPGNAQIPQDGYVISFIGSESQFVPDNVKVGDEIDLKLRVIPYTSSPSSVTHIISGGPRLIKQGRVYVSKHEEKFKSDISRARAARTGIGITRDGKVILAVVDGRPRKKSLRNDDSSLGMTLEEFAALMLKLGAIEAMNLDGGSSSTMWVKDNVISTPVTGYEQGVSNAIVIRPRI